MLLGSLKEESHWERGCRKFFFISKETLARGVFGKRRSLKNVVNSCFRVLLPFQGQNLRSLSLVTSASVLPTLMAQCNLRFIEVAFANLCISLTVDYFMVIKFEIIFLQVLLGSCLGET